MTVNFRSSKPMAGKIIPSPKTAPPVTPKNTPIAGKIIPSPKINVPKNPNTPMAGKVIKKAPVKKSVIVVGVLAFLAAVAALFKFKGNDKNVNLKPENKNDNFSKVA